MNSQMTLVNEWNTFMHQMMNEKVKQSIGNVQGRLDTLERSIRHLQHLTALQQQVSEKTRRKVKRLEYEKMVLVEQLDLSGCQASSIEDAQRQQIECQTKENEALKQEILSLKQRYLNQGNHLSLHSNYIKDTDVFVW